MGPKCGRNAYYRELRQRRATEASDRAREAKQAAEMDSLVDELVDTVVSTGLPLPPAPPAWSSLSAEAQRSLVAWVHSMDNHAHGSSGLESGPPAVC